MTPDLHRHPCFDAEARHEYARVHLPVAPACNVQCNFCDRKSDCPNESRPGVTSALLDPSRAAEYVSRVREVEPKLTVVGIAGPGDPFATPERTLETLRLVREEHPDLLFCVASNGLGVAPWVDQIAELNVSHVTITLNAIDPEIGAKVYSWVRDGKRMLRGLEAATVLLERCDI